MIFPRPGHDLVVTTDAMVEDVHFLADDPLDLVARKLLRVNLSDLAAKAAEPAGYLLVTAWSDRCRWAEREMFAQGPRPRPAGVRPGPAGRRHLVHARAADAVGHPVRLGPGGRDAEARRRARGRPGAGVRDHRRRLPRPEGLASGQGRRPTGPTATGSPPAIACPSRAFACARRCGRTPARRRTSPTAWSPTPATSARPAGLLYAWTSTTCRCRSQPPPGWSISRTGPPPWPHWLPAGTTTRSSAPRRRTPSKP